jgi:nitroimidazol reductase NimA-like FMN-containing flavoprotein (pyridoxamine 5'-phosphate oxidase superfamily)
MITPAVHHQPVLDRLTVAECLHYLRSHQVGRLVMSVDGELEIYPVNYVMDGDTVAVRTDPGSGVDKSVLQRVVFEVDHIDGESHEAWTVVVRGVARDVTEAIDAPSQDTRALPLTPWAPGLKNEWIKILDTTITGRRLTPPTG